MEQIGEETYGNLAGREVTLLERLHMKRLVGYSFVTEKATIPNLPSQSESSMDYVVNPSSTYNTVPVVSSPTKKIVKMEHDCAKTPHFFE